MPQSSGQRHGESVYRVEMPHKVSPGTITYRSGASGLSTSGLLGACAHAAPQARKKMSVVIDLRRCWTMVTPSLSRHPGPAGNSVSRPQCCGNQGPNSLYVALDSPYNLFN